MEKLMRNFLLILIAACLYAFQFSNGQDNEQNSEINSSVPELFEYHEVIYPMWHTAYPNKDYAMLKELLPRITEGAQKIYNSKLTGILRDKKNEWEKGIEKLRHSVKKYEDACKANDNKELLSSAEILHTNFEMLVRIIKPITKEVDEFHKVLYMIYHHYQPEKNTAKMKEAIDELNLRAEELKNCVLPKWASAKKDEFIEAAEKLYNSTLELKKFKDNKADEEQIDRGIEKVHSNYQKLEALFD
jgi:hypothetical protein